MLLDARPHSFGRRLKILQGVRCHLFLRNFRPFSDFASRATSQPPTDPSAGKCGQNRCTHLNQ